MSSLPVNHMNDGGPKGSDSIADGVSCETETFRSLVKWCLIIFLASFVPRFVYTIRTEPYFSDGYWEIAQSLSTTGDFAIHHPDPLEKLSHLRAYYEQDKPTAFRGPLTPVYLAICRLIFQEPIAPIRLFSVILGSFSSVLVLLTLHKIGASPKSAILGGLIWSFWPPAVVYSTFAFLTEPISQFLVVLILYLMAPGPESLRIRPLPLGLACGLLILNRSEFVIFVMAMCAYAFAILRYGARPVLTVLCVCALTISPWIARNYYMVGKGTLSTLDGLGMYAGNNPYARGSFVGDFYKGRVTDGPSMQWVTERYPEIWDLDEVGRSAYFKKAAIDYLITTLKTDPGHFFWLFSRKFMVFWHARDDSRTETWPDFLLIQGVLFAFGLSLFMFPSKRTLYLAVPMISGLFVALIVFPGSRLRFPYESSMIMFLVMQWEKLGRRLRIRNFRVANPGSSTQNP